MTSKVHYPFIYNINVKKIMVGDKRDTRIVVLSLSNKTEHLSFTHHLSIFEEAKNKISESLYDQFY